MSDLTVFPADLAEMSVSQLASLPPAQLVEADANLDHLIDWAKKTRTKLDAALDQRFGEQGRTALRDSGRDFGTAHNLGAGRLQTSTLRRRVNQRDWTAAATELRRWIYGGGKVLPGLLARREAEVRLLAA